MAHFPRREFQAYVAACEQLSYSRLDTEFSQEEREIVQHYQAELLALLDVPNPPHRRTDYKQPHKTQHNAAETQILFVALPVQLRAA